MQKKFKMHVSLQRRAQKCMSPARDVRGNPRHTKIIILPQFQSSDQHEVPRGLRRRAQNLRFTTVFEVRRARSDERVARSQGKFALHHSFGRPKCEEGCAVDLKFWEFHHSFRARRARSDKGLREHKANFHFTTVSDKHEVTRELSPAAVRLTYPG